MAALLISMSESPNGRLVTSASTPMHQCELLVDEGLAVWLESDRLIRITNKGYDYLDEAQQQRI